MAYKDFTPAQILTASEVAVYLMRQTVMVFATATNRNAAITSPTEGMVTYQQDTKLFSFYNGTAWVDMGMVLRFASSAARSTALPSPVEGMVAYLQDTDELQIYNGSAWLTVVVTSDDEGFSTTGSITSSSGNVSATAGSLTAGTTLSVGTNATITGSLTVDTSGFRVDATNDVVGVMTATPATGQYNDWSLDIASGRVRIGGGRSGGSAGIALGTGTPTGTWYNGTAFIGLEGTANSSQVGFWHSGAWRMLITNGGVVTTPFQPVFKAHLLTGGGTVSVANGGIIPLSATSLNVGSCFNTSNYRFTAPISGTYVFGGQLRFDQDQAYIHSMPFVNGAMSRQNDELPGLTGAGGSGQGFTAGVFSYLRYLNTNDYIQFGIYNNVGGSFNVQSQTFIFGYLQG